MKLTTSQISSARFHRRSGKGSCYKKLLSSHPKSFNGSKREIIRVTSPNDNSDDSGLGIENSPDYLSNSVIPPSVFRLASSQKRSLDEPQFALNNKRHRADFKPHNDLDDSYSFPIPPITLSNSSSICVNSSGLQNSMPMASKSIRRSLVSGKRFIGPPTLSSQLNSTSRNGKVQLQILNQPEQQHRARYQTEGSRGAVKDRTGNSFPVVKVTGYNKLTTLQVFIGSDQGRVTPHMFYQACRVTGKNSTPCSEKNINGTIVIEIDIDPAKDMTVTCDCVGILKERNVDVEHRFPEECSTRSKKKSTRCRMVFRAVITNDDGTTETLQIASQPIACTQPPGIPEICKKSLTCCPVAGGKELFILGKNFLKDTHVLFQTEDWEQSVNPDKEFLQQTHLVCTVPAFKNVDIKEPVNAKIFVVSGNRTSEPHTFTYTPFGEILSSTSNTLVSETSAHSTNAEIASNSDVDAGLNMAKETPMKTSSSALDDCDPLRPVLLWSGSNLNAAASTNVNSCTTSVLMQNDTKMMPPPVMLPRRSSVPMIVPEGLTANVKTDAGSVTSPDEISPLPSASSYVPAPYNALPDVPMIQEFARNFHTISDQVDHTTLKSEPVLKVEPLSEPSVMSCAVAAATADSYTVTSTSNGNADLQQQSQLSSSSSPTTIGSGLKRTTSLCASNHSPDIYLSDDNYLYKSTTDLYSNVVSKTEPRSSPTEELSYDVTASSPSIIPANTISSLMLPSTHTAYLNSNSLPVSNDVMVDMSASTTTVSDKLSDKVSDMMSSLNESAFKRKNFEFEKLLSVQPPQPSQQQQSPLSNCSLKATPGYEEMRSPFCYSSVPSSTTDENVQMPVYSNYMAMESSSSMASADDAATAAAVSLGLYKKMSSENKPLSPLAISMMENTLMSDMMRPRKSPPDSYGATGTATPVMPMTKTFGSAKSFLDTQSQNTMLNDYVSPSLGENAAHSVPKLEELVNSAADSHIMSAAAAAVAAVNSSATSLNLLNETAASNPSNATLTMNAYLTDTTTRNDVALNAIICNTTAATTTNNRHLATENSLLMNNQTNVYQPCSNNMVELSAATNKQPINLLEMKLIKEEKPTISTTTTNRLSAVAKKTAEGIFASEITGMSERELLNYINPSCFDEVQRWKNV